MNHADGTAPIYAQLIRERGDVPGDVRQTAEEVLRDLSRYIKLPAPAPQQPMGVGAPAGMQGMHQQPGMQGQAPGQQGMPVPGLPALPGQPMPGQPGMAGPAALPGPAGLQGPGPVPGQGGPAGHAGIVAMRSLPQG